MPAEAPTEFTLVLAEDECDRIDSIVSDMFAHEVAGRVANFAMLVCAMTETEAELRPILREAVRGLVCVPVL